MNFPGWFSFLAPFSKGKRQTRVYWRYQYPRAFRAYNKRYGNGVLAKQKQRFEVPL